MSLTVRVLEGNAISPADRHTPSTLSGTETRFEPHGEGHITHIPPTMIEIYAARFAPEDYVFHANFSQE